MISVLLPGGKFGYMNKHEYVIIKFLDLHRNNITNYKYNYKSNYKKKHDSRDTGIAIQNVTNINYTTQPTRSM